VLALNGNEQDGPSRRQAFPPADGPQ